MHYQCNQFKPLPPLHLLHWDKCSHSKTVPTSLSPTINKCKLGITSPATKVITNRREVVNNRTLPTMLQKTDQPKTPHNKIHQDATPHCTQTNHAHSVKFMGTTHSSVPSWLVLRRTFKTRPNRPPTQQIKPNPTQHHKDLPPWCFKTHYQSKD